LVNEATREQVRKAADRLGYRANRAARGLVTGRTRNLGIVVPDLANPVFPSIVKGIQSRAHEADYAAFLADSDEEAGVEPGLVRAISRQVDGVVLCSPRMPDDDLRGLVGETNLVVMNRRVDDIPSVTFDDQDGVRQAVAHLQALGHRRIAWVGGPAFSSSQGRRLTGMHTAAAEFELDLVDLGRFAPRYSSGLAAADLLLASRATAVVVYNDLIALGVLNRLASRGVDVPGQISVIGHDDIPFAAIAHPPLTTVALSTERAGRSAVELLLSLLERESDPDRTDRAFPLHRTMPSHLLVRATTGVAPPDA
jgi:DNA-binding LacI/PurR family transcriptional regulator